MSERNNLLIELGTEELPPKSLKKLSEQFVAGLSNEISKLGFSFDGVDPYGAPRRIGMLFKNIERQQADKLVEKRGPAVNAAFDANGQPTKAAEGWARSNGISVSQADRLITDKGEWLLHKTTQKGERLDNVLQGAMQKALKSLPIPKMMRWGSSSAQFIRPVHTVTAMFGKDVISLELFNIQSSNVVSGHRFHGQHRVSISDASEYVATMRNEFVLVDYDDRTAEIDSQLQQAANALGLQADYDQDLLEEISSLVEWPVVLQAEFDQTFLEVPKEALIYTMKDDQKYVPLIDEQGNLSHKFLFVSNIQSKDPKFVIKGNEKVIRPRLADARFFFDTDKKSSLEEKTKKLESILFQKQLGSVAERTQRMASIAQYLAESFGIPEQNKQNAIRAAQLSKADLVSEMVMEFPSVQGTMGKHYAIHDGESLEIAQAIEDQYKPRFSGDALPSSDVGNIVSLAEKLDTLVGIFGINKIPKGDKDPYALRRCAIGILRIIIENKYNIDIDGLLGFVVKAFNGKLPNNNTVSQVTTFLLDRCKPFYAEKGISADIINAVMAVKSEVDLTFLDTRINAVSRFAKTEAGLSLIAGNKRVSNILAKNDIEVEGFAPVDETLFDSAVEQSLHDSISQIQSQLKSTKFNIDDYLESLSRLEGPLEAFFDSVMIMADDDKIKMNRIRLVSNVRVAFLAVADVSLISV